MLLIEMSVTGNDVAIGAVPIYFGSYTVAIFTATLLGLRSPAARCLNVDQCCMAGLPATFLSVTVLLTTAAIVHALITDVHTWLLGGVVASIPAGACGCLGAGVAFAVRY